MIDADDDLDLDDAEPKQPASGLEDDEDLLKKLKRWERAARNHASKWREEARLAYDFVAGHQWSSEDKNALIEQMRQPVTFNRTAPMVDAVIGAEILNRQQVSYSPREQGDVEVNELITAADDWARDQADTEDEESDAFADTVIAGMGWTETLMDYSDDPEGMLLDDRTDPLEMWWDPQARKRNLADRRYHLRARWRDKEDLPPAWRKKLPMATEDGPYVDDIQSGHTGPRDDYEREDISGAVEPSDADKRRVWVRHFQWWQKEDAWRVADPIEGKVTTVTKEQLRRMGEMFIAQGMRPPKAVKIEQKRYYEAIVIGNTIIEKGPIEANRFTFNCITGKRDRNANTWYGVVRAMIDPQMWGNKFFVQIMHILNTAAKGGLLYEEDTLINPRKALEDWSKPDAAIQVKRGALANNAVQEREARNYPQGLDRLMEFTLNNLPQVSGVNMEMLGLVERDQPGVLEAQRKKAGYAILAVFFDSLRRYRKMKGRLRLHYIQNYISDGRLIRIKGQDSTARYVPLLRDQTIGTYDVIVDEAPMSPNQKEMVWQMMMGMMPMLSKLDIPPEVWGLMLEYSPLPSHVSGKINQMIAEQAKQPPPPDPEVEKLKLQGRIAQQKAQGDMARDAQELEQDREKHRLEMQALNAKTEATVVEAEIDQQTAAQKHQFEMRKLIAQAMMPAAKPSGGTNGREARS